VAHGGMASSWWLKEAWHRHGGSRRHEADAYGNGSVAYVRVRPMAK